jgi:hypothetical protein
MRWSPMVLCLMALAMVTGCISLKFGRDFPSPEAKTIVAGKTDKASLERLFGAPYQIGLDSGDQMWRCFYGERESGGEMSNDLTVRFNADGTVKSYAFSPISLMT